MIAAHELRIGSIVLEDNLIRTVTGIMQTAAAVQVYLDGESESIPLLALQPIPLSKELIEACWFEESEDGFWYEQSSTTLYPIYLMVINDNWDFSLTDPREVAYWKRIYYVHQLQNLYFSLNNEELEMEL
jgi:hypothetical protein